MLLEEMLFDVLYFAPGLFGPFGVEKVPRVRHLPVEAPFFSRSTVEKQTSNSNHIFGGNAPAALRITVFVAIPHGGNEMPVDTVEKLFVQELKDLYSAENQITKALPKMAKAATSPELRTAFESHLQETKGQIERLEKIFEILGKSPSGKTCKGMKGVLEEGSEVLEESPEGEVRDAALISAAQRVEHYEMAGYGAVRSYAELLGQSEIAELLQATLQEENAADKKLTQISKKVNIQAQRAA